MSAVSSHEVQLIKNTLSITEVRDRLVENERMMDTYLARITRLQMLLSLEEARLSRSQDEHAELRVVLESN